jgi:hypothetical protein
MELGQVSSHHEYHVGQNTVRTKNYRDKPLGLWFPWPYTMKINVLLTSWYIYYHSDGIAGYYLLYYYIFLPNK